MWNSRVKDGGHAHVMWNSQVKDGGHAHDLLTVLNVKHKTLCVLYMQPVKVLPA